MINYDIFKHKTGIRVVDINTNKRGLVIDIVESAYEWIEPLVKWDGSDKPEKTTGVLVLEET